MMNVSSLLIIVTSLLACEMLRSSKLILGFITKSAPTSGTVFKPHKTLLLYQLVNLLKDWTFNVACLSLHMVICLSVKHFFGFLRIRVAYKANNYESGRQYYIDQEKGWCFNYSLEDTLVLSPVTTWENKLSNSCRQLFNISGPIVLPFALIVNHWENSVDKA